MSEDRFAIAGLQPESGWRRRFALAAVTLFLFCVAAAPGAAAESALPAAILPPPVEEMTRGEEDEGDPEPLLAQGLALIAQHHATISEKVVTSAAWVDSIFDDGRLAVETQQSRLKLGFSLLADRDGLDPNARASLHLSLPMLSKRLQLQITDDVEEETAIDPGRDRWPPRDASQRGILAGLRYFFTHKAQRNSSVRASLRLRDGAPVLLLEPRYRQDFLRDPWLLRFTQRVIAYSNGELQLRTIFNLDRPLPEWPGDFFFRGIAEGVWVRERSGYFYRLDLRLLQSLGPRRTIEYAWINEFRTVPDHQLEASRLRLAWRQNVHWDWLFFDVAPQVTFPRERGWQAQPGILLNMEVIYGAVPGVTPAAAR